MRCPRCRKESAVGADFCVWCGTPLHGRSEALGRPLSDADSLPEIKRHLNDMAARLSKVEGRVERISQHIRLDAAESRGLAEVVPEAAPAMPIAQAPPAEETCEVAAQATAESTHAGETIAVPSAPVIPPAPEAIPTKPAVERPIAHPPQKPPQPSQLGGRMREWEQSMPGNWLSRVGMLALFIGLGFLTQWAYANDKLVRVPLLLVGLACGAVLLFAGHHWRKAYGAWAQALTGGGIGVLYLSFFASYALYADDPAGPVMSFYATFSLMFLVTVLAVGIALRRDSMAIAIIGIVGAFLVPVILGASALYKAGDGGTETNPGLMIAYILVLDAGIVGLSTFRKWRWFTLLGFAGSLLVYGLWYAKSGHDGSLAAAEWSLTGIFLCFAVATTLFHVVWRRTPELTDLALMCMNAAVYFCVSYALLWGDYRQWLGLFSVGMSGFYAMTGYLAWRRSDENRRLSLFAFAIAIVFLTIAIPVQLHRSYASWITAAWAVEGAALIWIAVRQKLPEWQLWGLGAFAMALVGLFAFNGAIDEENFRPFINNTFWAFTISILAFYAAAFLLRRKEEALQPWFFPAIMLTASVLTLWLFSGEIISAAGSKILEAHDREVIRNIENARSLGLVGLWAAYGLGILFVGARKNWDWLRVAGYGLMAAACGLTMILLNHGYAMVRSDNSHPIVNYAFGGFAICTVALYVMARVIAENRGRFHDFERIVCIVVVGLANLLTIWALSGEVIIFLGDQNLRYLVLVILWSGYGLLLMLAGVWKGVPAARFGGYGLIAIAAVLALTLLNHGHAGVYATNSNWVANYSFGGLCIGICAIYLAAHLVASHRSKLLSGEEVVLPLLIVAANLLSIYALSMEVWTYAGSQSGRSMGLTMLWAAYGIVLVVVGILGRWAWVRLGGLLVVVVAVLKLFILDTLHLDPPYRVAAYITVGVLLLAGGFVYHRYADVIKGFIMDRSEKGSGPAQK